MGPRDRLIASTIALMRERGVAATGVADLLAHSGTARGSIYQHFPGGKTDLVIAATHAAGDYVLRLIERVTADQSPAEAISALVEWWRPALAGSGDAASCPIAAAAVADERVRAAAAEVFASWENALAGALERAGARDCASLAGFIVAALEGAVLQSQAAGSMRPLENARDNLLRLLPR
ncbi:TetR/AcrR family transcriptional regulator [Actinokineospora sp. UTMC 2448]|uniref:TetR/AcrR family transcriptional regulator n=1 Tax=Actinokineospora sp. UTMC 2448 TaxID=2268449 RepID=UPI00216448CF|nr:TetR/AcrR family transcriptional regulator [Actinokineospora sp. UTMC 2448]UVS80082.1 putative HTH-type transcriptional regulator YxaF [Actinokineospora sp. UTMC 2448]